jgi:hypothetical protein
MRGRLAGGLVGVLLFLLAPPALAWGPAAHALVAMDVAQQRGVVFATDYLLLQAVYGANAPDLAWQASGVLQAGLATATHDGPGYRRAWDLSGPWSKAQRAFAWGWLTHNQVWGADYYAHIADPFNPPRLLAGPGYVGDRAARLAAARGIPVEVAHDYVEVAIDLLLDQQHPELGLASLLEDAVSFRDWQVPFLLTRSYSYVPGAGGLKISWLEAGFRTGLAIYADGLSFPAGLDDGAFAVGMAARYGLTLQSSAAALAAARQLCLDPSASYWEALGATSGLVAAGPWP